MADPLNDNHGDTNNSPFAFIVESVFTIRGKGTIAAGQVVHGTVRTGDRAFIVRDGFRKAVRVAGIETFKKTLEIAGTGMGAGLQLDGVEKADVLADDLVQSSPTERMFNPQLEQCCIRDCRCPKGTTSSFCDFHHQLHLEGKVLPTKSGVQIESNGASMRLVLAASSYESVPSTHAEPRVFIKRRHNMDTSEHVAYRAYKVLSYTVKFIAYVSLAGDMFGAMPVLFGSDSGKVPPAEWARAKLWSVIILVLLFIVSFGMMALDKVMAKRFGKK
jgi:hypothetical protein